MNRINFATGALLLIIAFSYRLLGPIETVVDIVLLLAVRWVQTDRLRGRSLALLALCVAAAWVDWWIVDFWFSCFLMIGRHFGLFLMSLSVLIALRRERPGASTPLPRIRGRVVLGFLMLILSFCSMISFLSTMGEMFMVVAGLAVVGHFAIIVRALWFRWGRSALLYPVAILPIAAFFCQLVRDSVYLHTVWKVTSHQYADLRHGGPLPHRHFDFSQLRLSAKLDCARHKDPATRECAVAGLGYEIYRASQEEKMMPGSPSLHDVDWWKHAYWDGAWSNSVAETALPLLIELLDDDDGKVRVRAARQFFEIGPLAWPAIPALRKLLRDHGDVAGSRVEQNGEYGASDLLVVQDKILNELGQGQIPRSVRKAVAEALASIGPRARDAIPDLIPLLQDAVSPVRVGAANALAIMGPFGIDAIPALEIAAQDKVFGGLSRIASATALWWIDPEHSLTVPIFQEVLNNGTPEQKENVAGRIAKMGPRVADWAIPTLIPLLDGENLEVREAVIVALCNVGVESQQAVEAVLKTLRPELAANSELEWPINIEFRRLVENARGPAAEALAEGMKAIEQSAAVE